MGIHRQMDGHGCKGTVGCSPRKQNGSSTRQLLRRKQSPCGVQSGGPTDDKDFVMGLMRKLTGGAVAMALLSTAATPAMARGYGGFGGGFGYDNGYGDYRHRHHDRVDAGDVIGAIAVVGIIAAIASAASKKNRSSDRTNRDDYPNQRQQGSISTENQAVDACAQAAEQRAGQSASVREISTVNRSTDGWDVEGVVEERDGWRDRNGDKKRFTCSVRYGAVDSVYIDSDKVAYR
jgi:hypothetical protein